MKRNYPHNFHIPVMGLGYTIDSPVKVARYGISSVVSIIEDHLIEQMREVICKREGLVYDKISVGEPDYRARRITAYLDLIQYVVEKQIEIIRSEEFVKGSEINKYFEMLPDSSGPRQLYKTLALYHGEDREVITKILRACVVPGSIDVNIMTKLDNKNYADNGEELPAEYSDAMAALRGYAKSRVNSSIIFSAGMNPRLFGYCEKFDDFFPNEEGNIKKRVILKVSDYRSALIQGKFLAKKGIWVSEFRIESGINCGGHAFVSAGTLLGPVLEEFRHNRENLRAELFEHCSNALKEKGKPGFHQMPKIKITAQGGIGTSDENNFLLEYYNLDATGWGSPFLLVPEVTNVDDETLNKLATAKQEDYYISHASPLGIPFNNFRRSSSEAQRKMRISKNKAGSPCYKKFLVSNTEFTQQPICTASRQYQKLKIDKIKETYTDELVVKKKIAEAVENDCLCEGLGAAALIKNGAKLSHNLGAVTICPGPNLAYFSGVYSLNEMIDHIYGRKNILNDLNRPHVFINELRLYIDYIAKELERSVGASYEKHVSQLGKIKENILEGINYYKELFTSKEFMRYGFPESNLQELEHCKLKLSGIDMVKIQIV
ncbi:MAG: hypothetical protein ACXVPN_11305 [Bacteroidia bacterium]